MKPVYIEGVSTASTTFFHTPDNRIPDFFYYPLCIGHYFCNVPYEVSRVHYNSFLLLYTKSGKGIVTVDGKDFVQNPGDVCMKDPYNYEKNWFQLYECFLHQEKRPAVLLSQYISQLLTLLSLEKDEGGTKAAQGLIGDSVTYINRHLHTNLTLEFLASRVSLSPYYFLRKFKEETGYTPYRYILISRINLAKFYLITSRDTVKNIGLCCGFKSEHSFCTAFKSETGYTPSEFRSL
ncbi:MAG: AraC family transcriptional regulator [Blautia sp.]|nr:AraC family transcriptional regulator [Blautia sp.]MDY3997844.1 AraC family transcriptional regulator [Blautia sp.]